MNTLNRFVLLLFFVTLSINAQKTPLKVTTKEIPNRLAFYALNENEQDFDVQLTITGTNFRQSRGRPRWIRVPAASKVHLTTIVLTRGKKPNYTYNLKVNDSLSKRALKKEVTPIKIRPKKSITVYITDACTTCDSIVQPLNMSNYIFKMYKLSENPEIKEQLKRSFPSSLETLETPILNIGGRLFTRIENYEQLLEELNKE